MSNVKQALSGSDPDGSVLHFTKFTIKHDESHSVLLSSGRPLYKDRKNNIIIGINEILKYTGRKNKKGLIFDALFENVPDYFKHSSDVRSIFEDRSGVMWIAYQRTGIAKFNPDQSQFQYFYNSSTFNLTTLYLDSSGNIWMGAFNTGLFRINKETGLISRYDLGKYGSQIVCMTEISPGILWIGTSRRGVLELNSLTGKVKAPFTEGVTEFNLRNTQVNNILKDEDKLYLTTSSGIFVYDLIKKVLTRFSYQNDSSVYLNNWTISPIRLKSGEIIIFTSHHGINRVNYESLSCSLSLTCLVPDSVLRRNNINLSRICRLFQDSHGLVWMVEKSGLHRIDLERAVIINYRLFKDIDSPEAWSVLEDDHSNLWIGTHFGLCRFNTMTGQVKEFTEADGVPIPFHDYNAAFKGRNGMLYFGGTRGFYSFFPDSIRTNTFIPPVVITNIRLFNESLRVDTTRRAILRKNISYTKLIKLHHDQNDISFEFAALDYSMPSRNEYSYRLEGYEDKWVETGAKNRVATYTNLDPGKYTFRVKGSNSDGLWNEEGASLIVIILKPWWGTALALIIYVLVFISAIAGYIRWRLKKLKKEKLDLENLVNERTRQIEEQKEKIIFQKDILEQQNKQITEHEQLKSRFFANVSHEFRTPLSLIQSPVEEMLDDPGRKEKDKRKLNMIHRNAGRLLNLVNQLLDISKIDGSKMKLELIEDDVMKYIRVITGSFCSLAESKKIEYNLHFSAEIKKSWFDPDKLDKIITNLLSNAFRFTPLNGEIIFSADYGVTHDNHSQSCLFFSVEDNGPGIPAKSIEKIFDRFYQVEESLKKEGGGTGIGLSLARDMARLMYGDITVRSKSGEGTIFSVTLPLGKEHLKDSEFVLLKEAPEKVGYGPEMHENSDEVKINRDGRSKNGQPIILIVEDNRDIRMQLSDNFNSEYLIVEAIDGVTGLAKATEIIPDLVITDLMMPEMDGMELCERLKGDERTSHIPVIMLTARASLDDKLKGYNTGADEYISKPFHMAELKVRTANLIDQRRKLRERFSREITLHPGDISITPLDEKFLNRAIEIIEKHMNDANFGIPEFREEMFMTRSTLFRKLQALTNQSPGDFIRTIRLKRAAILLVENFGNVTEISYEVGFSNLSSFNRSFRKLYGVSPTIYKKQNMVFE